MHKVIFGIGGFAIGAVTGVLASKKYFENLANEEIAEVKLYFENRKPIGNMLEAEEDSAINKAIKRSLADTYNQETEEPTEVKVLSFVENEEKLKKGGTNYAEMFKKPSLDELVVGINEEDEIGEESFEAAAKGREKSEEERFEILEDTAAVAENASIVELYYSEFNNRFEEENGDEVDIKDLIGEIAVARFVMGEDEMSVYDNDLEVLYELSRYDPAYDATLHDQPLSPKERRNQDA